MSAASAPVRRLVMGALMVSASLSAPVHPDQPAIPRIGVLVVQLPNSPYEAGLRDGLRELGYVEGKNIVIDWRRSRGEDDEGPFAVDLARSKADVIVVFSTRAALAALKVATAPVVFLSGDPLASGLAASLARPGGNATGVSTVIRELTAKRLELLRQLVPQARRIAILMDSSNPVGVLQLETAQGAARTLGLQLVKLDARNSAELDTALRTLPRSGAEGVVVSAAQFFYLSKAKIAGAIRKARLPAIFPAKEFQGDDVLMSYGPNIRGMARKMAVYVDKILKGAKPADLPVEQFSKYELIIDLRVARELKLNVPQELLLRADEVIR